MDDSLYYSLQDQEDLFKPAGVGDVISTHMDEELAKYPLEDIPYPDWTCAGEIFQDD